MTKAIPKKGKSKTKSQLDKELWTQFSLFIRLKYSDKHGWGECYTCGKSKYWKGRGDCANAGHFISRSYKSIKFDENNVRYQCIGCNKYKNGEPAIFRMNLVKEVGEKEVKRLEDLAYGEKFKGEVTKRSSEWFLENIEKYKGLASELLSSKDLKPNIEPNTDLCQKCNVSEWHCDCT